MNTRVRLVLSDVDGTLVTSDKRLTDQTVRAVARLREEGVLFAVTSGRPPRGLSQLIDPLDITTPLGALNGALIVDRDLHTLQELTIDEEFVTPIIKALENDGLSVWVYQGIDWFVLDADGPHVARESVVSQFSPRSLPDFDSLRRDIVKIVGVSDEPETIARATATLSNDFTDHLSATSSQDYYLDVTHRDANKGHVVDYLASHYQITADEIAVIGDMTNDLLMFARAGRSIAVANGPERVRLAAAYITKSNDDDGFAYAIEHFVFDTHR